MSELAGYREIDHTADWALEAWAPDLAGLLQTAAIGMFSLMGVRTGNPPTVVEISSEGIDAEALLVAFLSDLLRIAEDDGLAPGGLEIQLDGFRLTATLRGLPIEAQQKEIKAVTFHNLSIDRTERGLETTIVFDV